MEKKRGVVLGGGYAGILGAQRIAGSAPPGTEVVLVSDRPHFTERIRLHERVAGAAPRRIPLRTLVERAGVKLAIGRVEGIDRAAGTIRLHDGTLPFDLALVALGSRTDWERVPGAAENAFSPCDEDAAERLAAWVASGDPTPLVVIGGGLTAVETAAELAERGRAIHLITAGPLLPDHAPGAQADAVAVLRSLGVRIVEHARVEAIDRDAVHLEDGREIPGRAVWCGGFVPVAIGDEAGLRTAPGGQLSVDATLRTSDRRIFAAGDVARVEGMPHLRMGCATAMPLGAHAAKSILAELRGEGAPPFAFAFLVQCLSLGRKRGLIQRTDPWDRALDSFVRGRAGAFVKERISRFTVHALRWEQRVPGLYRWPQPPRAQRLALSERLSLR